MIVKCTCINSYQDKKYGNKMRIANATQKTDTYRCTVCDSIIIKNITKR